MPPDDVILDHYSIEDEFSQVWNENESVNNEDPEAGTDSRYSVLRELFRSRKPPISASLLQDEADPLGSGNSIMTILQARGVNMENDPNLRSKYLISSTNFSPKKFLRDAHMEDTYEELSGSLRFLQESIAKRSKALRELVEDDYDRFVKSKAQLDKILQQMQKANFNEHNDWGMELVKSNIDEANSKATLLMKPIVESQLREDMLNITLQFLQQNVFLFSIPSLFQKHIRNKDHEALVRDYRKAQETFQKFTSSQEYSNATLMVIERISEESDIIVDEYKKNEWSKLSTVSCNQNYMQIINRLLDLGVEDNPILEWIECQIRYFREEMENKFDKLRSRTNMLRSELSGFSTATSVSAFALALKKLDYQQQQQQQHNQQPNQHSQPKQQELPQYLRPLDADLSDSNSRVANFENTLFDTIEVVEMWIAMRDIIEDLSDLVERATLFWDECRTIIAGKRQERFSSGCMDQSKIHHTFSKVQIDEINGNGKQLVDFFIHKITEFFSTTASQSEKFAGATIGPTGVSLPNQTVKPLQFVPHNANAIGAIHYLNQIFAALVYSSKGLLRITATPGNTRDHIKGCLTIIRDKILEAIFHTYNEDCYRFSGIETWEYANVGFLSDETLQTTKMPLYFNNYHRSVLTGINALLNVAVADDKESVLVLPDKSLRIRGQVWQQFVGASSTIIGQLSNFASARETSATGLDDELIGDELAPKEIPLDTKIILTLGNLYHLKKVTIPHLLQFIEKGFSIVVTDSDALTLACNKVDDEIFGLFTRKRRSALSDAVRTGILKSGIDWRTSEYPATVSNYVYECLLRLVATHDDVYSTSPRLVVRVITALCVSLLRSILTSLRDVERFSKQGCLQATADLEFIGVTLSKYWSPEAQIVRQKIVETLGNACIDKSWRGKELPRTEIQTVVKEAVTSSRLNFYCFQA